MRLRDAWMTMALVLVLDAGAGRADLPDFAGLFGQGELVADAGRPWVHPGLLDADDVKTGGRGWITHRPIRPGTYEIRSGWGSRVHPVTGIDKFHHGIDLGAPAGTPIYAVADGTVVRAGWDAGFGWWVWLDHGHGRATTYAHMQYEPKVVAGDRVRGGTHLGGVGATGNVTGEHLHFEIWKTPGDAPAADMPGMGSVDPAGCLRF